MNPSLIRLQAAKPRIEPVSIPGVDGPFYVRGMNGAERAEFSRRGAAAQRGDRPPVTEADIVALTLVDETGRREIESGDATVLAEVDGAVLAILARKALELSGLTPEATEAAAKN